MFFRKADSRLNFNAILLYSPQKAVFPLVLLRVEFLNLAAGEDEEVDCGHHVDDGGDVVHYLPPRYQNHHQLS